MANIGRPRRIRLENFPRKPARWLLTCRVFQRARYWRTRRRSRQRQKVDTVTVSVHGGRRLVTTNETTMNDWDWLISLYIIHCLCPGVSLALSQYISSGVRLQTEFLFRFSILSILNPHIFVQSFHNTLNQHCLTTLSVSVDYWARNPSHV